MSEIEQAIADFKAIVEKAIEPRISSLKEEISRVSSIHDNCGEWIKKYQSWEPKRKIDNPAAPSQPVQLLEEDDQPSPRVVGKIDFSQFELSRDFDIYVFGKRMPRERVRISGQLPHLPHLTKEQVVNEVYPKRKENLEKLVKLAEKCLRGFERYEKIHAITQYSIYKRKEYNWAGDGNIAHPYQPELLSPERQADYLVWLHRLDRDIYDGLLSNLARINGSPSIMQAMNSRNREKLVQILSASSVLISEEITAWSESLDLCDIADVDKLLTALNSVKENFFLKASVPPLDDFGETIGEALTYKEWPGVDSTTLITDDKNKEQPVESSIGVVEEDKQTPQEDNSPLDDYKEPDNEEQEQYFICLRDSFKDSNILNQIVTALYEQPIDCIDEEDKAVLYYRLSGNCLSDKDKPDAKTKVKWHTKYSDKPGDKGKVRHPNELYYLLSNMYKSGKNGLPERVNSFFEFKDGTAELVDSAFKDMEKNPKSAIRTKGQSAPRLFQEKMNEICPNEFPLKR